MSMKIMFCGALVLGGFLWSYLFMRQFIFNIRVASPVIKKMNSLQPDLIAVGAKRYTLISNIACLLVGSVILFAVIWFTRKHIYYIISFGIGAVAALIFILVSTRPENQSMFDYFSGAYYRFIPDDELRTIVFNKEYKRIKPRLRDMGISGTFVPKFNETNKKG